MPADFVQPMYAIVSLLDTNGGHLEALRIVSLRIVSLRNLSEWTQNPSMLVMPPAAVFNGIASVAALIYLVLVGVSPLKTMKHLLFL